jgi:hypothetical protein
MTAPPSWGLRHPARQGLKRSSARAGACLPRLIRPHEGKGPLIHYGLLAESHYGVDFQ